MIDFVNTSIVFAGQIDADQGAASVDENDCEIQGRFRGIVSCFLVHMF
jgi:hypothetical protein